MQQCPISELHKRIKTSSVQTLWETLNVLAAVETSSGVYKEQYEKRVAIIHRLEEDLEEIHCNKS